MTARSQTFTSLRIVNVRAADAEREYERLSLGIREGRIAYAGTDAPDGDWEATLDGDGLLLLPAWVELAARLREPGATHKAAIASELLAAQRAGIGTLVLPPDTRPVIDRPAVVDWIRSRVATAHSPVTVHLLGAASAGLEGTQLSEMGALAVSGCVGVCQTGAALADSRLMRRTLEYAATCGLTLHIQPQDAGLAAGGCAHEGPTATRLGLPGIPSAAESGAIAQWLALVEATGARLHFSRLSSARGAQMVAEARAAGLPVSADVALPNLLLDERAVTGFDAQAHLQPPLRGPEDRDGLRMALAHGGIPALCCDHQPHDADAKNEPFPLAEAGASGLDSAWPLALHLVDQAVLSLPQLVRACHSAPLALLGSAGGGLAAGAAAALALIDPADRAPIDSSAFASRGRNTPFDGHPSGGRVVASLLAGSLTGESLDARLKPR